MSADNKKGSVTAGVQAVLDADFVPLPMATAMAYFDITGERKVTGSELELADISRLVAIALSTVAPIYRMADGAARPSELSAAEINTALFQARPVNLTGLLIRRADLERAIVTLKEARASFDSPGRA